MGSSESPGAAPGRMTLGRATGEWHVQESSVQGPGGRRPEATAPAAAPILEEDEDPLAA